jgi:hypothetical protein
VWWALSIIRLSVGDEFCSVLVKVAVLLDRVHENFEVVEDVLCALLKPVQLVLLAIEPGPTDRD